MAEKDFQHRKEDNKFQPADFPTSSLATLHLRDEAVVINESTNFMVDNPEPHSVFPVMMSASMNQSRKQTTISMATRLDPSPAVQGKIKRCYIKYFKAKILIYSILILIVIDIKYRLHIKFKSTEETK